MLVSAACTESGGSEFESLCVHLFSNVTTKNDKWAGLARSTAVVNTVAHWPIGQTNPGFHLPRRRFYASNNVRIRFRSGWHSSGCNRYGFEHGGLI